MGDCVPPASMDAPIIAHLKSGKLVPDSSLYVFGGGGGDGYTGGLQVAVLCEGAGLSIVFISV